MPPILRLDRSSGNICDIRASSRLCDGNTGSLLPCYNVRYEAILKLLASEFENWGETERNSCGHGS